MSKTKAPKEIKPTFAIVVDGETEVCYFQMLKRNESSILVNIEPKIPQRKKLSEQYENVVSLSEDYTKVFWIIDFDVILKETEDAKNAKGAKAGKETPFESFLSYKKTIAEEYENIVIIVNNPCLEFWFLLHFEKNIDIFKNCNEAILLLEKHFIGYKKKKTQKYFTKQGNDIYLRLKPNLAVALKNAKALKLFDIKNPNKAMSEMQLFFEASEFGQLFKNEASC